MSRDFVGALLQLNAEKQVSREQLIGAVEDGIQSAYRRVAGDEDIHVRIDAESGRIRVYRARLVVERDRGRADPDHGRRRQAVRRRRQARRHRRDRAARRRRLRPDRRPDRQADRPPAHPRGRARPGLRPVRRAARASSSPAPSTASSRAAIILDVGKNVEAILATTEQSAARALPHRPERQGVRARGPSLRPRARRSSCQPHAQGLPAPPVRARGARDPQRHRRDQGHRPRGRQPLQGRRRVAPGRPRSGRRDRRPARRARPGRRGRARPARRSTSSRGATTPACSSPTR